MRPEALLRLYPRAWRERYGEEFLATIGPEALGPQQVIDKILYEYDLFRMTRFLIQFSVGTLPHPVVMRAIELYGTKVAPVVRQEVASRQLMSRSSSAAAST